MKNDKYNLYRQTDRQTDRQTSYAAVDILKFFLAIGVVALHACPLRDYFVQHQMAYRLHFTDYGEVIARIVFFVFWGVGCVKIFELYRQGKHQR